jgi:hypothetical protein
LDRTFSIKDIPSHPNNYPYVIESEIYNVFTFEKMVAKWSPINGDNSIIR